MSNEDIRRESPATSLSPLEDYDDVKVASSHFEEKTEVIYGGENVTNYVVGLLDTTKKTLDLCGDRYSPSIIVANEPIMQKYFQLYKREVRQRVITELTNTLPKAD